MRPSSPYLDSQIGIQHPVLDHGFVMLIDYMGNEESIIHAARQSYTEKPSDEDRSPQADTNLLRYLMRHRHTSPLEQCEISVQMKLPIFVARQIVRHRTANLNEYSARYAEVAEEFYLPAAAQMHAQSKSNKQGSEGNLDESIGHSLRSEFIAASGNAFGVYQDSLKSGLSREQARIVLPLSTYTIWTWKIDLHNLLHFLSLRLDKHAQWEVRHYAGVLWTLVKGWVPRVAQAFEDYRLNAVTLTAFEVEMIKHRACFDIEEIIKACAPSKREAEECMIKLVTLGII